MDLLCCVSVVAATTRICADGGANRLYDQIPDMVTSIDATTARQQHLPDLIKGDLDSVRPEVRDFYMSRGVPIIDLSSDQDTTDLEKCLLFLDGRVRAFSQAQASSKQQKTAGHTPVRVRPVSRGYGTAATANGSQQQQPTAVLRPVSTRSFSSTERMQALVEVNGSTPVIAAAPAGQYNDAGSVHSSSMQSSQSEQQVFVKVLMLADQPEAPKPQEQQQQQLHQQLQQPQQQRQLSHQESWQQHSIATSSQPGSSSSNGRSLSSNTGLLPAQSKGSQAEHLVLVLGR